MITTDIYINNFECFISRHPSSWVTFEPKMLCFTDEMGRQIQKRVMVPRLNEKPSYLIRLIYVIFEYFLETKKITASQLYQTFQESIEVLSSSAENHELLQRIARATESTLKRIVNKNAHLIDILRECKQISRMHNFIARAEPLESNTCYFRPAAYGSVYRLDQQDPNSSLFDPSYLFSLIATGTCHPDIENIPVPSEIKSEFIHFLTRLMDMDQLLISMGMLSRENTDRVRQMTLAILNTLCTKRQDVDFKNLYASVIMQFTEALKHCSNGVNTNIENIFIELALPKDGSLGYKVKLALQMHRDTLMRRAIQKYVARSDYYQSHEAASVNYYYRKLAGEFGLLPSVSALDERYTSYAMPNLEDKIRAYFKEHYTPIKVIHHIHDVVHNPYDPAISSQSFTDWILAKFPQIPKDELLDESGNYFPIYTQMLLEDLGLII
jgi:hypothetical protein